MASRTRSTKGTTLNGLIKRAKIIYDLVNVYLDSDDDVESEAYKEIANQRERLLDDLEPLLRLLVETRMFEVVFCPEYDSERENPPQIRLYPLRAMPGTDGEYTMVAERISYATKPPPKLRAMGDPTIDDPATFIRIPVTGHAVFEEMWQHEGKTTRVLHTRPLLADSSHVEFIDSDFELLDIQPTSVDTYAVFGSASDDIDLREESFHVEELLANDRAYFLGFLHGDIVVDWLTRLEVVRSNQSRDDDSPGVYLRGEYRQMPRLNLDDPKEDED